MKRSILVLSAFLVVSSLGVLLKAQAKGAKYTFKIATELPPRSNIDKTLKNISKELSRQTNREVAIQVYPGGVMGGQTTMVKKMGINQLQGSTLSTSGMEKVYKDAGVLGLPLVIRSAEQYDAFKKKHAGFFENKFEENGYKILAWTETGPVYIFSKQPVNSISKLKTTRPFVIEGETVTMAFFEETKTTPVPLHVSDILTSLQTGMVDTVYASPKELIDMQWHSKITYMADFPVAYKIMAVVIKKDLYDTMPPAYQKQMEALFKKHFDALTTKIRKDNETAKQQLLPKVGIRILPVSKNEEENFLDAWVKASNKLLKEYSRDVYNKVKTAQ